MSTKEAAAEEAATARANLNTWAAVVALMENWLLSGPSPYYAKAQSQVIKIANAQIQAELARYNAALEHVAEWEE